MGIFTTDCVNVLSGWNVRVHKRAGLAGKQSNLLVVAQDLDAGRRVKRELLGQPGEADRIDIGHTGEVLDPCRLKELDQRIERAAFAVRLHCTSFSTDRRNRLEAIDGDVVVAMKDISVNGTEDGAFGNPQFRMIEGSLLPANTVIGQRLKESDHRFFALLVHGKERRRDHFRSKGVQVDLGEVTTAGVEGHDLLKGGSSAIVEVGTSQLDIS